MAKELKGFKNKIMWAYFSPDGELQVRSIASSRKYSRVFITTRYTNNTWKDYEQAGFKLSKIVISVKPII